MDVRVAPGLRALTRSPACTAARDGGRPRPAGVSRGRTPGRRARRQAFAAPPRRRRAASTSSGCSTAPRRRSPIRRSRSRAPLRAKVVRAELTWSMLEPHRAGQIDPRALAFTDRLVERRGGGRDPRDLDRATARPAGPPRRRRRCWRAAARARRPRPTRGRRRDPAAYAAIAASWRARYGTRLAAIEVWNEPDQANERVFRRARKGAALRRDAARGLPGDQAGQPERDGAGGLARRLQRRVPARAVRARASRATTTGWRCTSTTSRSPRCARSTKCRSRTATRRRCGWTSSAGAAAGRAQRIEQEQACVTASARRPNIAQHRSARSPRTPYVAAAVALQAARLARAKSSACCTPSGRRKPAFTALAARC